ncbi:SWI5-dependent HO expression protein 4 [[Candida] railenensis]|uniref:SWI5-dependent HO expression protein 4 n=1 Tax=[Candida] railenensis TaxID=45579 RepID=A0A9P0QSJ9_9ASCO|nr:SWI5-dependent HO expression protein 4 [[Candida] railenensis]
MGEAELDLEKLSLDDFNEVFGSSSSETQVFKEDLSKLFPKVSSWSSTREGNEKLKKYFDNDPVSFLNGLLRLNDVNGTLLLSIVNSEKGKSNDILNTTFDSVRKICKDKSSTKEERKFFLTITLILMSEFNHHSSLLVPSILTYLSDEELSPLVLMILVRNLQQDITLTTKQVEDFFDTIDIETQFLDFIITLNRIFPLFPQLAAQLFVDEKTLSNTLAQVAKLSTSASPSSELTISILNLISSSCVTDQCRTFNAKHYLSLLKSGTKMDEDDGLEKYREIRILSTLCVIKIWNFIESEKSSKDGEDGIPVENMYQILISELKISDKHSIQSDCVEGLAYLTLNGQIRTKLRSDENAIEKLISLVKAQAMIPKDLADSMKSISNVNTSFTYGLILILANLSKIDNDNSSPDKKTKSFLRNFSTPDPNAKKNSTSSEKKEDIILFNKSLLMDYKVIECASKVKVYKQQAQAENGIASGSHESKIADLIISLIHSISCCNEVLVKRELIKQGALKIVLDYLIGNSKVTPSKATRPITGNQEALDTRQNALRSLARMIVSVNPTTAFNTYDVKSCIPFLTELLGPDISEYTGSINAPANDESHYLHDFTNLDKFESLLALTNLSADTSNEDLRHLIINKTFEKYIGNFLLETDIPSIQRAAWELISNLITDPILLAKFFNLEISANKQRLEQLIKLLESEDENLQVVIAGVWANATSEFQMVNQIIVKDGPICNTLLESFMRIIDQQQSNQDLITRVSYILANLVYGNSDSRVDLDKLKNNTSLKSCLKLLLSSSMSNQEIKEAVMQILQLLK